MSGEYDDITLASLAVRLADLEQAHTCKLAELERANTQLRDELATLWAKQPIPISTEQGKTGKQIVLPSNARKLNGQARIDRRKKSRRSLLRQGIGVAAAAVGAGALLAGTSLNALANGHPHRHLFAPNDNLGIFSSSDGLTPAVTAIGTNGSQGVYSSSDSSDGVFGLSGTNGSSGTNGVHGKNISPSGSGVFGENTASGYGVSGSSLSGEGVLGIGATNGVHGQTASANDSGVWGENTSSGFGVSGSSISGSGVYGQGTTGFGVQANSSQGDAIIAVGNNRGIHAVGGSGSSSDGPNIAAVFAETSSNGGYGIYATSTSSIGIYGSSSSWIGIYGSSGSGYGIYAQSDNGKALWVKGLIQIDDLRVVGQVKLPSGQKSVMVYTAAATTSSNVLLTPLNKYKGTVWVTLAAGNFTIHITVAQSSNVVFTYLIIN